MSPKRSPPDFSSAEIPSCSERANPKSSQRGKHRREVERKRRLDRTNRRVRRNCLLGNDGLATLEVIEGSRRRRVSPTRPSSTQPTRSAKATNGAHTLAIGLDDSLGELHPKRHTPAPRRQSLQHRRRARNGKPKVCRRPPNNVHRRRRRRRKSPRVTDDPPRLRLGHRRPRRNPRRPRPRTHVLRRASLWNEKPEPGTTPLNCCDSVILSVANAVSGVEGPQRGVESEAKYHQARTITLVR